MPATIVNPEKLNSIEVIQVVDHMDQRYPKLHYSIMQGNDCICVYWRSTNLYFRFRDGKIADIQVD